jgi:hypothetical protein
MLHREAGLCSFLAVPIGPASKPWGVLSLACADPGGLTGSRWRVWPNVAAVALVHHVRHWQTVATCSLLRQAAATTDQVALIRVMLTVSGKVCRCLVPGVPKSCQRLCLNACCNKYHTTLPLAPTNSRAERPGFNGARHQHARRRALCRAGQGSHEGAAVRADRAPHLK